jgi:hypothetical protein
MPDTHPRIVRNSKRLACKNCGAIHDYITRDSDDAACGTPVAFGYERAVKMANLLASGTPDIERITSETIVVMDDTARKLPRNETGHVRLAQFSRVERSA